MPQLSPEAERQRRSRERLIADGGRIITVRLDESGAKALETLERLHPAKDARELVNASLVSYLRE